MVTNLQLKIAIKTKKVEIKLDRYYSIMIKVLSFQKLNPSAPGMRTLNKSMDLFSIGFFPKSDMITMSSSPQVDGKQSPM